MHNVDNGRLRNLISISIIILLSILFCIFIYKSQVKWNNKERICYTLMSAHKENNQVILSREQPELVQDFICRVPELKKIKIQGVASNVTDDAVMRVEVIGLDDGSVYYEKEAKVSSFYSTKKSKKTYKLKGLPKETNGLVIRIRITLISNSDTTIALTYNQKPGTVTAFNGDPGNCANIIYSMMYGRVSYLSLFFCVICGLLIVSVIIIYLCIFVSGWDCRKWFPIVAFVMGMTVQLVVPVYGVPDEPWHMDTAYQLSNVIMNADKSREEGTVLKRECDIITADLLANDVESNSYYQLYYHTFEKPENTALKRVTYVDAGLQVPDLLYLPAALGIITGRLFNLSGMMVYQLARIFSLIVYVMLAWTAIKIIPFCNSMLAMISVSLIVLQQAASASYDAMINGIIFLFTSLCLDLAYGRSDNGRKSELRKHTIIDIFIMLIMAAIIAMVKGGVYIPLLFMVILISRKEKNNNKKGVFWKRLCGLAVMVVVAIGVMLWKYMPFLKVLLSGGEVQGGERYTPAYVLKHPAEIIYMCWRTIIKSGDKNLRGLFGGVLGWHNIEIPWLYIIPMIIGILLLVHVENERPPKNRKYLVTMLMISLITIIMIMLAMLFACTKVGRATIWGIQGRYFIPVEFLMLSVVSTPMITVSYDRAKRIEYGIILFQVVAMLQVVINFV